MKMIDGMKNNLCFEENKDVVCARQSMMSSFRHFPNFSFPGWILGLDEDTGDVLVFLPEIFLPLSTSRLRQDFLSVLRENWMNSGFKISEERTVLDTEYFHVGLKSLLFRLEPH